MREQAIRIARGDYAGKVEVHGKDELGQLAETFNNERAISLIVITFPRRSVAMTPSVICVKTLSKRFLSASIVSCASSIRSDN